MSEHPILMAAPMVRALLDGRKTQTRRVLPQRWIHADNMEEACTPEGEPLPGMWMDHYEGEDADVAMVRCPFGVVGDRLWVRETWAADRRAPDVDGVYVYRATDEVTLNAQLATPDRWHPSIHMPRRASRITLEVTEVRVQRLQDISEEDAIAEGVRRFDDIPTPDPSRYGAGNRWSAFEPTSTDECLGSARFAFGNLVNKLAGIDVWAANPLVWAISFARVGVANV